VTYQPYKVPLKNTFVYTITLCGLYSAVL